MRTWVETVIGRIGWLLARGARLFLARGARLLRSVAFVGASRSDVRRWRNPDNYDPAWLSRNLVVASLIPAGSRVLDLGAGQQYLRELLGPTCEYRAADLTGDDRTIQCDLNARPLPDFASFGPDVCVLSGVLEYVDNVPEVARWLAITAPTVIASYVCAKPAHGLRAIPQRVSRAAMGWLNDYSEAQLVECFRLAGFSRVGRTDWEVSGQPVFEFRREDS